jgi:hypothetical protein
MVDAAQRLDEHVKLQNDYLETLFPVDVFSVWRL